ncbi:MAG: dethiobiotin synthase [Candidatus Protochlamydia sp.]|nr:dethiobiotin synthase [Candidatus Protochlamydia sp.]
MPKIIIAGTGTDAGKTLAAAVLTVCLKGDYWKPVQCGPEEESDSTRVKQLIDSSHRIHLPAFAFERAVSPHYAARLESTLIRPAEIIPPQTKCPLIIESVGGVLVPLTDQILTIDLFKTWAARWVIVSRHYIGSINHTLLTIEALKRHQITIGGILFNGEPNADTENVILHHSRLPLLGRLLPEPYFSPQTILNYAEQWKQQAVRLLL